MEKVTDIEQISAYDAITNLLIMIIAATTPSEFFLNEIRHLAQSKADFLAALYLASEKTTWDLCRSYCRLSKVPAVYAKALEDYVLSGSDMSIYNYLSHLPPPELKQGEENATEVYNGFIALTSMLINFAQRIYQKYYEQRNDEMPLPNAELQIVQTKQPKYNQAYAVNEASLLITMLMYHEDIDQILDPDAKAGFLNLVSDEDFSGVVPLEICQALQKYASRPLKAGTQEYVWQLREAFPELEKGKK